MSTAIAGIEYNAKTQILRISFVKGGGHLYWGVPPKVVQELRDASSQGRYFNENIRNNY